MVDGWNCVGVNSPWWDPYMYRMDGYFFNYIIIVEQLKSRLAFRNVEVPVCHYVFLLGIYCFYGLFHCFNVSVSCFEFEVSKVGIFCIFLIYFFYFYTFFVVWEKCSGCSGLLAVSQCSLCTRYVQYLFLVFWRGIGIWALHRRRKAWLLCV